VAFSFNSAAIGDETKTFRFKARTWDTLSSSTVFLSGEYEVAVSSGKCDVTKVIDGALHLVGGNAAAELCRMVGVDPDKRMYVKLPLEIGKEWVQEYNYNITGDSITRRRTATYRVVAMETVGAFATFRIEGDARISNRSGKFDQKWVYNYNEATNVIVKWHYDSAVGQTGAKMEIDLVMAK